MRDELLTTALCWEMQSKVSVEYARTRSYLTYYCAEPNCIVDLTTARRKNLYFIANARHVPGCKNDTEQADKPVVPGLPKPRPSIVPECPIPTVLGSASPTVGGKPSAEERRALALKVAQDPVYQSGTLEEVVSAWIALSNDKKRQSHLLSIRGLDLDYKSAFKFITNNDSDVSHLECQRQIVFGAATVSTLKDFLFVQTLKRFDYENTKIQLRLQIKTNDALHGNLLNLVGKKVTLFWHGEIPLLSRSGKAYNFAQPQQQPYNCIAIREGHLIP